MNKLEGFDSSQLEQLDKMLPITGRGLFRDIAETAFTVISRSTFMESFIALASQSDAEDFQEMVEKVLIDNFLWPALLKDNMTPYGKDKTSDLANFATSLGIPLTASTIDLNKINKRLFDNISSEAEKIFGADIPQHLERGPELPIAGALIMSIAGVKYQEGEILRCNPAISPMELSKKLESSCRGIIKLHGELVSAKAVSALIKESFKKAQNTSRGGYNSKSAKDAIFTDFIDWVMALPDSECERFDFPIHAGRYYLRNHIQKRKPHLVKHVSSTTARTACEKLSEYCDKNQIKNPLIKSKNRRP